MLRHLHCIESMHPSFGGPAAALAQLLAELDTRGIASTVATLDAPGTPVTPELAAGRVIQLGPGYGRYMYCPRLKPWLRSTQLDYDIIFIHGLWRYHSAATRSVALELGVPYYLYAHSMLDPWLSQHGTLKRLKKTLLWHTTEHKVLRDARRVLYFTEHERNRARLSFLPYDCRDAIAPLGTGDPSAHLAGPEPFFERWPALRGRRLILFLGRIHPVKGCDLLIRAFARVSLHDPLLHLVMAGPDTDGLRSDLERLARAEGAAARVTWTGGLYDAAKWGAICAADLLVLPSHSEGLSYSVLEALGSGKPVLVTDKVASHPAIRGCLGGLVTGDTFEGIHGGLARWLSFGPEQRAAYGERARQCYLQNFHSGPATTRLLELIGQDFDATVD